MNVCLQVPNSLWYFFIVGAYVPKGMWGVGMVKIKFSPQGLALKIYFQVPYFSHGSFAVVLPDANCIGAICHYLHFAIVEGKNKWGMVFYDVRCCLEERQFPLNDSQPNNSKGESKAQGSLVPPHPAHRGSLSLWNLFCLGSAQSLLLEMDVLSLGLTVVFFFSGTYIMDAVKFFI